MKHLLREIFAKTTTEIDVDRAIGKMVRHDRHRLAVGDLEFDLAPASQVTVIALGKAAVAMSSSFLRHAGLSRVRGVIATNQLPEQAAQVALRESGFELFQGGHPAPNRQSLAAAERALTILGDADEEGLTVFLISGGGSALMEKPIDDQISLEDLRVLNHRLVTSGAAIAEMNTVRKHLSAIKGGRLALASGSSSQISLYISDTNPGDLASIASGPTLPDESTWAEVREVIARYGLGDGMPPEIRSAIQASTLPETPKAGELRIDEARHQLVLGNSDAVAAAAKSAREMGLRVTVIDDLVEGDYREVAAEHLRRLGRQLSSSRDDAVCLVSGGEVSCQVHGNGVGGRNQEFVLYSALWVGDSMVDHDWAILSGGTDGIDGNSPAAGAAVDAHTMERAVAEGLDPSDFLRRNDSYHFFTALGDAILTGPTGNNVRDVRMFAGRRLAGRR